MYFTGEEGWQSAVACLYSQSSRSVLHRTGETKVMSAHNSTLRAPLAGRATVRRTIDRSSTGRTRGRPRKVPIGEFFGFEEICNSVSPTVSKIIKGNVRGVLETTFKVVHDAIARGAVVELPLVGRFETYAKKATNYRDPHSRKIKHIPSRRHVKFAVDQVLTEDIRTK